MSELSIAVRDALREEGLSLINEPKRFSGLVLSKIDSDSREAKVIHAACDEGYLSLFVALGPQPNNESLSEAVAKASKYLDEEHVINYDDAWNVSRSIAEGLGSFLGATTQIALSPNTDGVKVTKHRGPRKGGPLTTVMISAAVFLALSIAGGLVAWHFIPFNGCTLLPRKSPIGEVDASWYATKDIYGNMNRVVFLRNSGNNPVVARSSNSLYGDERGYSRCILSPGDEGILLLKGDDGVSDIQVTDYADSAVKANDLSWSILDKDGSNYIKIESASGKDILLNANALTVATRGATVSTASCNLHSGEKLHSGDRIRIDSMVQHMSLGTDLVINDNTDVFINGVRIPRAEG